jgi:hypothetical protein
MPAKFRLTSSGMGTGPPRAHAPQTIWAVRSTSAVTCMTLSGRGPTATRPWLAISAAARPSNAFYRVVADLECAGSGVLGAANVPAAVHRELVDARRNRLMRDSEHGGPHWMAMDHAADVVERLIAREMQLHFRQRESTVISLQHSTIGVDQHQISQRHVLVVDRRRGDDEVAVLPPSRDVSGCSLDQAAEHVLGRR